MKQINQDRTETKINHAEKIFFAKIGEQECLFLKCESEIEPKCYALKDRAFEQIKQEFSAKVCSMRVVNKKDKFLRLVFLLVNYCIYYI
jgi:hypothetical protein